MSDRNDKIIVFDAYDTVVAANLVKTKLDAFGIPCFLSDENFVALYPIRNEVFPGVRLHIFETDLPQVRQIVNDTVSVQRKCPACNSTNIFYEPSRKSMIAAALTAVIMSLFLPVKKIYCCHDCKREFDSIEDT
ncbi:MAG: DUF2007 domain-containing protein [Cyclobacteriaceae bacterium]|nr:DUF2007 domain-containing protein [Cytophagales bacterium]MBX2901284.1 DUF2007 domain-containing protein [Cyclobacteriaceae bacterium]